MMLYAYVKFDVKGFEGFNPSKEYVFKSLFTPSRDEAVLVDTIQGIAIGRCFGFTSPDKYAGIKPTRYLIHPLSNEQLQEHLVAEQKEALKTNVLNSYKRFSHTMSQALNNRKAFDCSDCPFENSCNVLTENDFDVICNLHIDDK